MKRKRNSIHYVLADGETLCGRVFDPPLLTAEGKPATPGFVCRECGILLRDAFLDTKVVCVHEEHGMEQLSLSGMTRLMDSDADIRAARERYPDATHVVVFENHMLDSSEHGARTAMLVGPSNTYRTLDALGADGSLKHLYDTPSQRQYAALSYLRR